MVSDFQLKFPEVNKSLSFILGIAENATHAEREFTFIKYYSRFCKERKRAWFSPYYL